MPREYSKYQQKVISRYYENRDQIDEQKLSELVTNLFLATGKKQIAKHWGNGRKRHDPAGRAGEPDQARRRVEGPDCSGGGR